MTLVFGIDFSGDASRWSPLCSRPNVWVCRGRQEGSDLIVEQVLPVQYLPGYTRPFERLGKLLAHSIDAFAAIDAPFSVPASAVPGTAISLWRVVADLPRDNRPFARGQTLVEELAPNIPLRGAKVVFRATERYWREQAA